MSDKEKARRKVDEQKRIFDMVTKAWLDDKFAQFGRFNFRIIMALVFILCLRFVFHIHAADLRELLNSAVQISDLAQ